MILRDLLVKDGHVFIHEYLKNKTTQDLVQHLVETENLEPMSDVHRLTPKKEAESTLNTYSGQYGHNEFPMHTDLAHWFRPPRYILLRCVQGNNYVSTKLLDGNKIVDALGVRVLERALVKPRRPIKGKLRLMRIFQSGTPSLFRWDETFIVPASPAGEAGISAVINILREENIVKVILRNTYDTLLIDNWRMLHGRSDVPDGSDNRIIERVYLGDRK